MGTVATGECPRNREKPGQEPAAVTLGRMGGLQDGQSRAESTPKQRGYRSVTWSARARLRGSVVVWCDHALPSNGFGSDTIVQEQAESRSVTQLNHVTLRVDLTG
jgi:hypothetical protein